MAALVDASSLSRTALIAPLRETIWSRSSLARAICAANCSGVIVGSPVGSLAVVLLPGSVEEEFATGEENEALGESVTGLAMGAVCSSRL